MYPYPEKDKQGELIFLTDTEGSGKPQREPPRVNRALIPQTSASGQWLIKHSSGFVKDEIQAAIILSLVAAALLTVSFYLFSAVLDGPIKAPKGFGGNIPNDPVYQNPPRPEDLR